VQGSGGNRVRPKANRFFDCGLSFPHFVQLHANKRKVLMRGGVARANAKESTQDFRSIRSLAMLKVNLARRLQNLQFF
jgi:hypothetical protein